MVEFLLGAITFQALIGSLARFLHTHYRYATVGFQALIGSLARYN